MAQYIWKFDLQITAEQTLRLPYDAELLAVGNQQGRLCLWAIVDPAREREPRRFAIYATGQTLPISPGLHVGTVVIEPHVWHVFEI